ncbi:hypothetical protein MNBD_BACTEROID05-875 [hydrothermal vent metagenome]|uniref:Uncharacterized protein n=1 Tax=hydrothermal vent metagenome TaxID=652676 RepID=A0A3B0U2M7_9ZZZZ
MKILSIIILFAVFVFILPLDAFCSETTEIEHHHGIVLCHASCHGAVLTSDDIIKIQKTKSSRTSSLGFIYEAPDLPTEERPPLA